MALGLRFRGCLSEHAGYIPALFSRLRIWCCNKLWHSSQMWLGSGVAVAMMQATATALMQLLAQILPNATGAAIKKII